MESTITRTIAWTAVMLLLAGVVAACGGATQALPGTAPSLVSQVAGAAEGAGTFGLFNEGKGKGPAPGNAEDGGDAGDIGGGHGHGTAMIQIEGFTTSITGQCPSLTIEFPNNVTVTTVDTVELKTDFQRAACEDLADPAATSFHLHIAAKMQEGALVATYVRMQGPKGDGGVEGDETP
jgi:hypothetical protein